MSKKIAFAGPWITQKEVDAVVDAVKNGWYETYDMHIKMLEKRICDYTGAKYCIATFCCTHALHVACAVIDLKAGDEVICTDHSWVATAYAIVYTGATPVFVDIEYDTWCISPKAIREAITPRTKAIMLVHNFGHPAQMDEILQIAKEHNLKVIEDAAPALGATFKGQKVGTFGDIGCFSFQGAKLAVSGEGGAIVTDNEELYTRMRLLCNMGRTNSQANFWSDFLGYEYCISNICASLALAQVERIGELLDNKHKIFNWYYDRLKDNKDITIFKQKEDCFSTYCYPFMLLKDHVTISRDTILKEWEKLNIHARGGFPRMSRFPIHEQRYENPVAKLVEERGLVVPAAANLVEEDIDFVCQSLMKLIGD